MHFGRDKLIYLHPPKTGGNSIQSVLLPFSDDRMVVSGHQEGKDRFEVRGPITTRKHAMLSDYAAALRGALDTYRIAISVRHPFERAVSYFFSPHRWMRERDGRWIPTEPQWDHEAFISWLEQITSQSSFLKLDGVICKPHFLIRYEFIQVDFGILAAALGIPPIALPHVNRSFAPQVLVAKVLADVGLRRLVCDMYAEDMDTFGYH